MAQSRRGKATLVGAVQGAVKRGLDRIAQAMAPADDALDALDLLRAQHRYVEKLFGRLSGQSGQSGQIDGAEGASRRATFNELADTLAVHAAIEEQIFYPAVKTSSTEALLFESAEEHLAMKRVLADMLEMDVDADEFDAKLSVLQEMVTHHAKKEEEAKLFPLVRARVSSDLRAGLASEMIALMVEIQQKGNARAQVPAETADAAPI